MTGIKYSEDNLSHVLSDADYLEIPTRRRNFTISFAALDYTNSLDIEYAYKLDDNQWYYIGKKNSVSFVSLPAGKYQFQIKATNGYLDEHCENGYFTGITHLLGNRLG